MSVGPRPRHLGTVSGSVVGAGPSELNIQLERRPTKGRGSAVDINKRHINAAGASLSLSLVMLLSVPFY